MLRRRSFQLRGKHVELRELTDLIAVRTSELGREHDPDSDSDIQTSPPLLFPHTDTHIHPTMSSEVSSPQIRAFEDNGWIFVAREEVKKLSLNLFEAKIFIKAGGRLALGTNKFVVKLQNDPDKSEANKILKPYGCRVLEKLSFAPGLMRAEVNSLGQDDAIDVVNHLVDSGVCEFAEPELIEALSER